MGQSRLEKPSLELHIAVQQIDKISLGMLETQLWPGAAAAISGITKLNYSDGIALGDLNRPVAGKRVRQDDFATDAGNGPQSAFNRLGDMRFLVQRLDYYGYAGHCSARLRQSIHRCLRDRYRPPASIDVLDHLKTSYSSAPSAIAVPITVRNLQRWPEDGTARIFVSRAFPRAGPPTRWR